MSSGYDGRAKRCRLMNVSNARGAVKIWFPVERDSIGYPESQEWEQLWSRPTDCGYQIHNIPFFTKGVAYGDIVAASQTDQGWLCFDRVVAASGNSTFRVWLDRRVCGKAEEILKELRNLGGRAEITLNRLVAVNASPLVEQRLWQYLQEGVHKGHWDLQVGSSTD